MRLDLDVVHRFIAEESYWGRADLAGRVRACDRNIALLRPLRARTGAQAGFARMLTDRAIRAHLNDVFVLPSPSWQGPRQGAGMPRSSSHPELADCHDLDADDRATRTGSTRSSASARGAPGDANGAWWPPRLTERAGSV